MNMPSAMTKNNYDKAVQQIVKSVQSVAEETMVDAASEINSAGEIVDTSVSCDGS